MKLFHSPGTRSTRVLWTLEEIGEPYELVTLTHEQRRSPDHTRRHPLGRVPVLELEAGQYMFESAAICLHLADLHPDSGLIAPTGSYERAQIYQWSVFAMTELEGKIFSWRTARRNEQDETPHAEAFAPVHDALTAALNVHTWIAGPTFSVADVLIATMLANVLRSDLITPTDPFRDYVQRAQSRPACERAEALDVESRRP
jgi:glutathione S-transferase